MSNSVVAESKVPPARWIPTRAMVVKISVAYALLGALWILYSGQALHQSVQDPALLELLENVKGWFFILVTGCAASSFRRR